MIAYSRIVAGCLVALGLVIGRASALAGVHESDDKEPRLADDSAPRFRVGDAVQIEWHGSWWPGKVLRTRYEFTKVHYDNYGPEWDEWVEPQRLRAPVLAWRVGQKVMVDLPLGLIAAEIVGLTDAGYQVRPMDAGVTGRLSTWVPPSQVHPSLASFGKGDPVQVLWGGRYWACRVLAVKGDQFKIHYEGWGPEWDEWVGLDRMQP